MRSTASSSTPYSRVETIDWNQQRSDSPPDGEVQSNKSPSEKYASAHAPVDIGLVLKLQQKLKDVEKEKGRLIRMVEDLERDSNEESSRTQDSFRVSEGRTLFREIALFKFLLSSTQFPLSKF